MHHIGCSFAELQITPCLKRFSKIDESTSKKTLLMVHWYKQLDKWCSSYTCSLVTHTHTHTHTQTDYHNPHVCMHSLPLRMDNGLQVRVRTPKGRMCLPVFGLNPTFFKNGVSFVLHSSYLSICMNRNKEVYVHVNASCEYRTKSMQLS